MQNIIGSFTQLLILPSPLLVSWSSRNFLSTTHPTNNEKNMPPTGNNMLDDTKSNKSNNVFPQMVNELITPNDNEQSTPRTIHIAVFSIVAFFRDIFSSSTKQAMQVSLIEMVDVNEAKNNNMKNADDHKIGIGKCWNIDGSISNTNFGPASADIPNENTAGKIITPASIATNVSNAPIVNAFFTNGVLSLKYDA